MARVTVEDCITKIPNRFELVLLSAYRSREIGSGAPTLVPHDRDKKTVVALREIADSDINLDHIRENLVKSLQKVQVRKDVDNEEILELLNSNNKPMNEEIRGTTFDSIEDGIPSDEGLNGGGKYEDVDLTGVED